MIWKWVMKWVKDKIWCWEVRMQRFNENIEEDLLLTIQHEVCYWNKCQHFDDATESICIRLIRSINDIMTCLNSLI